MGRRVEPERTGNNHSGDEEVAMTSETPTRIDDGENRAADVGYQLRHDGQSLPLARHPATEGAVGLDISGLLGRTGAVTLDVGFMNTASCQSAITYIDGDAGILRYRGYPIEE